MSCTHPMSCYNDIISRHMFHSVYILSILFTHYTDNSFSFFCYYYCYYYCYWYNVRIDLQREGQWVCVDICNSIMQRSIYRTCVYVYIIIIIVQYLIFPLGLEPMYHKHRLALFPISARPRILFIFVLFTKNAYRYHKESIQTLVINSDACPVFVAFILLLYTVYNFR